MSRKKIDLSFLPTWLQYFIALLLVTIVTIAGYLVGHDQPVPKWIEKYLIQGLGWLGLVLILLVVIDWLTNILRSLRNEPPKETPQQSPADNTDTSD